MKRRTEGHTENEHFGRHARRLVGGVRTGPEPRHRLCRPRVGLHARGIKQSGAHLCPATVKAIRLLTAKWPHTVIRLIEDKANGWAVIQMLMNDIPGLLPITPEGGKVARAAAVSPLIEAGNVYLPPTVRTLGLRPHRGM